VLIETGGYISTEDLDQRAKVILDVKCPASGEAERNHWPNLTRLRPDRDEVKFVIVDRADWDFTRRVVSEYDLETRVRSILISPAWEQIDLAELANWIVESGMNARIAIANAQVYLGTLTCTGVAQDIDLWTFLKRISPKRHTFYWNGQRRW